MKTIGPMSGAVALRIPPEDVMPEDRVPLPTILQAMVTRYEFMNVNEVIPGNPVVMHNGKASLESGSLPFAQAQLMPGGDVIFSSDTDAALAILEDMKNFFTSEFGYRFDNNRNAKLHFHSSVVVEFEGNLKNVISSLSLIEKLINQHTGGRFLKRLAFGLPDHDPGIVVQQVQSPLDSIEKADFLIERRVGSETGANRFFCTAPLSTNQHLAVLQELENISAAAF